jgi:hypothetical protein
MHGEATRTPHMAPWGRGEGRKNIFFLSLIFYNTKYFYLRSFLNSHIKTSGVNIDLK